MADRPSIEWWRGAVIYQVYPRSFQDSNGDGIGDLAGITQRLEHIASLGVDAVWISPFFKSPMADYGYDVEDYRAVDPMFGSLGDFDNLLNKAHKLGLKLLVDLVPCHTSDQHHWFQEARQSRNNAKADWYVFAEPKADGTPPNNWLSVFGGVAWTFEPRRGQYYMHNFLPSQPQLNWHHQEVQDAVVAEAEFWLERGVDGFRVDAIDFALHDPNLKDNPVRPRGHVPVGGIVDGMPFARQIHRGQRDHPDLSAKVLMPLRRLSKRYGAAFLLGEMSGDRAAERLARYTDGGGLDAAYTFELLRADGSPELIRDVVEAVELYIRDGWACYSFSNHDVTRAVSRFGPHEEAPSWQPLMTALLCSLRGTICLYQGEELGLTEADLAFEDLRDPYGISFFPTFKGRDGCRTPMPWGGGPDGGFTTGKPWLPIPVDHLAHAVDLQEVSAGSVLNRTRRFLAWRQAQPALRTGDIAFLPSENGLLALTRTLSEQSLLCLFNLSAGPTIFEAPGPLQALEGHGFDAAIDGETITLPGYGAFFGALERP